MPGRPTKQTDSALRREESRFRTALLRWYDGRGRDLPWRKSRDPYRVWVAEVMLQQTRIAVVAPAYERFLQAFPTVEALAAAGEDRVLSLWSGLGYYGRARSLRRAAQALVRSGRHTFPGNVEGARALPGVGEYTANAVLSIAYGLPLAAVDGNVVRVLSRLRRLPRPDSRGEPHRSLATHLLHPERPGDFNQAVMDLGQTVCTPRAPSCVQCPVRFSCEAFELGEVASYPKPKPRRRVERLRLDLTLLRDLQGRLLLQRGEFPYLRRMWLPPIEIRDGSKRSAHPHSHPSHAFRHAILHRQFDVSVRIATISHRAAAAWLRGAAPGTERRGFAPDELAGIGRSALLSKALRVARIAS